MNTYYDIFGVYSPMEAKTIIEEEINIYKKQKLKEINNTIIPITNLEEYALLTVGKSIYEKLIKNYTEKQWGKKCSELPQDVIKRLPLRYSFNNNYFNDRFQAIPKDGYTQFVKNIIGNIPYLLNWNFNYNEWHNRCKCIIHYIAECRIAKDRYWLRKSPLKFQTIILYPLGILLEKWIYYRNQQLDRS